MTNNTFVPKYFLIQSIAQGQTTVVTFTANHDYSLSEYVSFRCDKDNKMVEINQKRGKVLALTPNTVTVDIDSTNYTPFVFNQNVANLALAVPAGSGIDYSNYVPTVILVDVFDNQKVS